MRDRLLCRCGGRSRAVLAVIVLAAASGPRIDVVDDRCSARHGRSAPWRRGTAAVVLLPTCLRARRNRTSTRPSRPARVVDRRRRRDRRAARECVILGSSPRRSSSADASSNRARPLVTTLVSASSLCGRDAVRAEAATSQLAWSIGLLLFAVAAFMGYLARIGGATEIEYRLFYCSAPITNVAWLALGTVFIVAPRYGRAALAACARAVGRRGLRGLHVSGGYRGPVDTGRDIRRLAAAHPRRDRSGVGASFSSAAPVCLRVSSSVAGIRPPRARERRIAWESSSSRLAGRRIHRRLGILELTTCWRSVMFVGFCWSDPARQSRLRLSDMFEPRLAWPKARSRLQVLAFGPTAGLAPIYKTSCASMSCSRL